MKANIRRVHAVVLAGAAILLAASLHSEEPRPDCRAGGRSQLEMNACAGQRAEAAMKRLAALLAELDGGLESHERQALAEVQARWAKLRDLDCKWERSFFENGSEPAPSWWTG